MKVVMIGTGNAAHVLGRKIMHCGHNIIQVAGRNIIQAQVLGKLLDAPAINIFSDISKEADFYIVSVADQALSEIRQWLPEFHRGIVVHTAGAVGKEVLRGVAVNYGVLYPLQSLRSNTASIPEIPFLIDGNSQEVIQHIRLFASSLSNKIVCADDNTRLKLHTAAVVVNNFSNYLLTCVQHFCSKENIDFSLLLPLASETVSRLEHQPAEQLQTGPAIRNDRDTIARHLQLLQSYPELAKLYQQISESIIRHYHHDGER